MTTKVLIVDDSRTSRMFIQQALEIAGLRESSFAEAANGQEALDKIASHGPFTLMVTDINMPGKGGLELIRDLSSQKLMEPMKVVVISSTQSPVRDAALLELGVTAILEKPINMQKVLATFSSLQKGA